ncbi:PD-(D/E)XK nuclease family protein [Patescibacteria group bacterium]|nr:PD-(D/E)XK nuclease family protein [Patescibacteria group bacterium]
MITITPTKISDYIFCAYKYWLTIQRPKIKAPQSPEAVVGAGLHMAINRSLYRIVDMPKARQKRIEKGEATEYFYKTLRGFISFSAGLLAEILKGENGIHRQIRDKRPIKWPKDISPKDLKDLKEKYLLTALWMAKEYYIKNQDKPAPFLREKKLRYPLAEEIRSGVSLVGIIDQVRKNSQGQIYIADLKTGFDPFDYVFRKTEGDVVVPLTRLYINYQLSTYWYLFSKYYGEPHMAALYYLKTGQIYLTHRTEEQIQQLFEVISRMLEALEKEDFRPTGLEANHCRYCDYSDVCKPYSQVPGVRPRTIDEIEEGFPDTVRLKQELEQVLQGSINYRPRLKLKKR